MHIKYTLMVYSAAQWHLYQDIINCCDQPNARPCKSLRFCHSGYCIIVLLDSLNYCVTHVTGKSFCTYIKYLHVPLKTVKFCSQWVVWISVIFMIIVHLHNTCIMCIMETTDIIFASLL